MKRTFIKATLSLLLIALLVGTTAAADDKEKSLVLDHIPPLLGIRPGEEQAALKQVIESDCQCNPCSYRHRAIASIRDEYFTEDSAGRNSIKKEPPHLGGGGIFFGRGHDAYRWLRAIQSFENIMDQHPLPSLQEWPRYSKWVEPYYIQLLNDVKANIEHQKEACLKALLASLSE